MICDQTKTQETLQLAEQSFTNHPKSELRPEVTNLALQCRQKLLASDVNVFNFYLNGNNYKAAQKRLDAISKDYISTLPTAQPQYLELTIQLAQAQNDQEKVLLAQTELVPKIP